MKRLATALALALLTGAAGASAAQTSSQPSSTQNTKTPAYAAPLVADANAMKGADELHRTNLRQQLQDQLTKAGYTSVKITPSSFFIRAKDKNGNPVEMVVGPDTFAEVTDVTIPRQTAQQQQKQPTQEQKSGSTTEMKPGSATQTK